MSDHSTLIIGVVVIVILMVVVGVLVGLSIWAYDDYTKKKAAASTPNTKSNSGSGSGPGSGSGTGNVIVNTTNTSLYPIPANTANIQTYLVTNGGTTTENSTCYASQTLGSSNATQTVATNATAIGWKLVNNSDQTINLNTSVYFNAPNCIIPTNDTSNMYTLGTVGPNSTLNWYDNAKTINNVTYYNTMYTGMTFFINSSIVHYIPTLNPATQYVVITVNPYSPSNTPGSLAGAGTVSVANADGTPV